MSAPVHDNRFKLKPENVILVQSMFGHRLDSKLPESFHGDLLGSLGCLRPCTCGAWFWFATEAQDFLMGANPKINEPVLG